MLRGEDVDFVSRGLRITAATLYDWLDQILTAAHSQ
jgi:hypothetical protein